MEATRFGEALESLSAAFRDEHARRAATRVRAERARDSGRDEEAEQAWRDMLERDPSCAAAWAALSELWQTRGRFADALDAALRSIDLEPLSADAHVSLGRLSRDTPVAADATRALHQRTRPETGADPSTVVDAFVRAGNAQIATLNVDAAIDFYMQAIDAAPAHRAALENLSTAFRVKGDRQRAWFWKGFAAFHDDRLDLAIASFSTVADSEVATAQMYLALGYCLETLARFADAARAYAAACRRWPGKHQLWLRAVMAFQMLGRTRIAIRLARQGLRHCPHSLALRRAHELALPAVYANEDAIDRYRRRFARGLAVLAGETRLDSVDACRDALEAAALDTNFFLAYQGRDDRDLQVEYGAWVTTIAHANYPQWSTPRQRVRDASGPLRIGYASGYLSRHTVADLFFGWVRHADRDRLRVHCYHLGRRRDTVSDRFRDHADVFRHLPDDIERAARAIADDDLDVLVYLDIGMLPAASVLASLRLAPVQCAAWGHPVTTGLQTIDYFISADAMEPEDGARHYSETLVRLPGIGVSVSQAVRPFETATRAALEIDEDATVYLCCQSPYKYLPRHDRVLVEIARRVPRAQFVFIDAPAARALKRRLHRAFAQSDLDASRICRFVPTQAHSKFLRLMTLSDVYLDSIEWSGGHSTLEAIAMGVPIVTWPRGLMRGRHSAAMLTVLGVTDTIVSSESEYIETAVSLAENRRWRDSVSTRMAANLSRLHDDLESVRALEDFYVRVSRRDDR